MKKIQLSVRNLSLTILIKGNELKTLLNSLHKYDILILHVHYEQ